LLDQQRESLTSGVLNFHTADCPWRLLKSKSPNGIDLCHHHLVICLPMDKLLAFLNGLGKSERIVFCDACGTTERYLRKAISAKQPLGAHLCINIDRESRGAVPCEFLRPDVDFAYLRGTSKPGFPGPPQERQE
jgi:hypothetical protein